MQNEKILRIENFQRKLQPQSILKETHKEKIILEQVKRFEREFAHKHPERKLFLYPKNEFNQQKYLPTTIKPTLLEQSKYSNYFNCADFFSNYIKYEMLEDVLQPPSFAPSPYQVLKWKQGDSLDMAILQASFIIGSGYKCFVVMGNAS